MLMLQLGHLNLQGRKPALFFPVCASMFCTFNTVAGSCGKKTLKTEAVESHRARCQWFSRKKTALWPLSRSHSNLTLTSLKPLLIDQSRLRKTVRAEMGVQKIEIIPPIVLGQDQRQWQSRESDK